MTTKQLGNISEAKALAKLVSMNIPVYVSFGDNEKADLVADFNGKLNKLQVKTSEKLEDGKFTTSLKSSTIRNVPYVETHNQHKSLNYEDYLFDKIIEG